MGDLAKNIGMPDSLLSRFDLVFVVRDLTTEEIDRKIASQVLKQAQTRVGGKRRGLEQVHSTILQRRQEASNHSEATEVFEKLAVAQGEEKPQVVTVDFLKKYLRYCKIRCKAPVLNEEARAEIAARYVDMRMRFQTGFSDAQNPDSEKKPKLAVTTRTLEALIRLATAHAKLKLRADEVTKEDVIEAYKLMLAAREEETVDATNLDNGDDDFRPDDDGNDGDAPAGRSAKRRKRTQAGSSIASARVDALQTMAARAFADKQDGTMDIGDLLERVNAELLAGEQAFSEEEFNAGLTELEARNKVMVIADTGSVVLIS